MRPPCIGAACCTLTAPRESNSRARGVMRMCALRGAMALVSRILSAHSPVSLGGATVPPLPVSSVMSARCSRSICSRALPSGSRQVKGPAAAAWRSSSAAVVTSRRRRRATCRGGVSSSRSGTIVVFGLALALSADGGVTHLQRIIGIEEACWMKRAAESALMFLCEAMRRRSSSSDHPSAQNSAALGRAAAPMP